METWCFKGGIFLINYHDTQSEINLIKSRIEILNQEKESLKSLVAPKSVVTDKINIQTTTEPDKSLVEYTYRNFEIDKEIALKFKRLEFLEPKLKEMETYLRQSKGLKQKVFVMRYVDYLSVKKIAWKLNYCERRIQQILKEIEKEVSIKNTS